MNYPAVTGGDEGDARQDRCDGGRPIDGHCPAVTGRLLNAMWRPAWEAITKRRQCEEAKEKLARGLYLLVREATNARNLAALLPMINSRQQPADLFLHG